MLFHHIHVYHDLEYCIVCYKQKQHYKYSLNTVNTKLVRL